MKNGDMRDEAVACDPVALEIIVGALRAALSEMGALLERTAMSAMIREKKDYWVSFFDPEARMVAGTVLPLFGQIVKPIIEHYPIEDMRSGDVYWFNDCYATQGAVTHSPDQVFVAPVFVAGELCGFVQSWAHLSDIGGSQPGSISPDAKSIFEEGIIIPPVRLFREGVENSELRRIFERNSRYPDINRGDMRSLVAALRLGERRFTELVDRFGRQVVLSAFQQVQDRTERRARSLFQEMFPVGTYSGADVVDTDGCGNGPFHVRVKMDVNSNGVSIDTSETDDQAEGPINYIMHPVVPSLVFGIFLTSHDPFEALNDGMMRLVDDVVLRPGSLVQPIFPAPVGQRSMSWLRLQSAIMALIAEAAPGRGIASNPAYTFYFMRGVDPATGKAFLLIDGVAVGYGARSFADGHDAVYFVAQENYPAEFINSNYPVFLRKYAIRPDSGGPGRYRGGCGVIREIEVLADEVVISTRIDATVNTPWGIYGGQSGRPGRARVNVGRPDERVLDPLSDGTILRRGDILQIETGGGGGVGHPFDRPSEDVRLDVLRGFVGREGAREDYGVVLTGEGLELDIDEEATARLRAQRGETKLFHRNIYIDRIG
ncbi:hydantoinase B/oxoprolinase family protein [Sphingobium sp. SA916]|uniref:hydantoinase B/oxoprolinase family protein n=1 Tax=Sphingobium sp. SA916 TaxID=1851207 RepID=UPI000C9FE2DC|nr:hydantoinase B/oxoprolinase family protein [Sphingobium sp. SA916]